jgi:hypothetical protein
MKFAITTLALTAALAAPAVLVAGGHPSGGSGGGFAARMPAPTTTSMQTSQTSTRTSTVQAATTGQPNKSCSNYPSTPGGSASAPGSAFNPSGTAGTVYAGQQPQNSGNPKSVSQYDVACSHQP